MIDRNSLYAKNGFSLLELLLAISVIAALFTGVAVAFSNWAERSVDRSVSREIQELQNAAREYVRLNLENIIVTGGSTAGQVEVVGDVAEIDLDDLRDNGFLPNAYSPINSYRQTMRVFIRYLDDNTVNGDVVEVLSFSEGRRIDDKRLFNAASNGEESVGVISNLNISATCCNGNAQSVSGAWSVPLTNYTAPLTITPPNAAGGYMAAYDIVSVNDQLSNDYLFRDNNTGAPELNQMQVNLDLNNNDIVNAGVIVSDSMDVGGDAIFSGTQTDGTASPYVLAIRDNLNTNQDMTVTFDGNDSKGNVTINGDDNIAVDFTVTGTLNMAGTTNGNISAVSVDTDNITIGGLSQFNNLDNGGQNLDANNVANRLTTFNNTLNTSGDLQATNMSSIGSAQAASGVAGSTIITNTNGLTVASPDIRVSTTVNNNGTTDVGNITATGVVEIGNMTCGSGCP